MGCIAHDAASRGQSRVATVNEDVSSAVGYRSETKAASGQPNDASKMLSVSVSNDGLTESTNGLKASQQRCIFVGVGWMAGAEDCQRLVAGIGHVVRRARRNFDGVPRINAELGLPQTHASRPPGNVINLLGCPVQMQVRRTASLDDRLRKTHLSRPVLRRMKQLTNLGSVLCYKGRNIAVRSLHGPVARVMRGSMP